MSKLIHPIKSISHYHQLLGLSGPHHPHFSVVELEAVAFPERRGLVSFVYDFYIIFLKRDPEGKYNYRYGQRTVDLRVSVEDKEHDFDTSRLFFMAPGQTLGLESNNPEAEGLSGWMLLIHPDYLWATSLAKSIHQHAFFHYSVSESLFLAPQEEKKMISIIQNIQEEYMSRIDTHSQAVVIAELELLFTYAERFYDRQFITRKIVHHGVLDKLEALLDTYFKSTDLPTKGLPTVEYVSDTLNISPGYLRSLLKALTGLNTQEHIHKKLIETAKEKLSTTDLSVSQIAYELGFGHAPSFSKLFKTKTNQSPLVFRASVN